MKTLSSEEINLLDRLYNLRSDDSVILTEMNDEKAQAEQTKEKTGLLKEELQQDIAQLNNEESLLSEQGEKLKNALETIKGNDFALVLEKLSVNFDPKELCNKVEEKLPETIKKISEDKLNANKKLVQVEEEMEDAITKIEELEIRKEEAIANQELLDRYINLSLSSNINITRDELTTLLSKFGFNEEEQREAAKIIMFPEDALFEYEKEIKNLPRVGKSISEVIQQAKETVISEEEPIIDIKPIVPVIEDIPEDVESESVEEVPTNPKDNVINLLQELGIDYLTFTNNDFNLIVENFDKDTITSNVQLVNDQKINKDIFTDNVCLLYDKELKNKINKLSEVGKLPQDIYLNSNVLVKYSFEELNDAIKTLSDSGLEPKNVPLMAY